MEPILTKYVREPNAHTLDFFVKHQGYEGLKKSLGMKPLDVIELVKASGLRGRGGAGFPTGLKWQFVLKDTPLPKYICCNADESEPGTFKDHVLMERNPHLLFEGCLIGCWAIGAKVAYIYIRGEFYHVQQIMEAELAKVYAPGLRRQEHHGLRLRLRHRDPSRRRRLRGRRGNRAPRIAGGEARAAAHQAAVPGGRGPLRRADRGQQRRDALQPAADSPQRRRMVRLARPREERRAEAVLRQRPREEAGHVRSVDEDDAPRAHLRSRGRDARRAHAEGGHSRRIVGAHPVARSAGHPGELRRRREGRIDARLGRHHRDGRHDLHGVGREEPAALLQARVVRQVHALP